MTANAARLPELPLAGRAAALPAGRRRLAGALLLVSFGCNLTALFVPFMQMRTGLTRKTYTLFHSAAMLWSSGLQVLAVLVVAFSVVFPFVKLGLLGWLCRGGSMDVRRRECLGAVDRLGKWSMLDVFLVCLILALSSGQVLLGARPLVGLPLFATAIVLSMACGELLSTALPPAAPPPPVSRGAFLRGGGLLALSGIVLAGTVGLPLLQIHDWFVADRAYSVVSIVPTLIRSGSSLPAAIIGLFLILLPGATWLMTCLWWWRMRCDRPGKSLYPLVLLGQRWSMLDVFGLALAIFAVEGGYLIKTEVRWGALFLAGLVAGQHILRLALRGMLSRN